MIHFKTVKWSNFLSTGNNPTEVILDKSKTTLIIGENGAGKSTVLDALCFGLFGIFSFVKKYLRVNLGITVLPESSGNLAGVGDASTRKWDTLAAFEEEKAKSKDKFIGNILEWGGNMLMPGAGTTAKSLLYG